MINPMKDSGVEWIGEIPSAWDVTKIKYTTQLNGRIGWQGLTSSEYKDEGPFLITGTDFQEGRINFESAVHIDESRWKEAKQIQVENGDLLITKDGTVGKVAIIAGLNEKASLNSGVLRIRTNKEVNRKFLYYVLLSEEFWFWFNFTNSGASTILHLYQNVFDTFTYVVPPIEEQQFIVNFLDEETKKLYDAKAILQQQIEKLKEYRESLIWETVTKGLDKTVSTKNSGVDWIGEIPEEWDVKRLKDYVSFNTGGTPKGLIGVNQEEIGVKWFKPADLSDDNVKLIISENYIDSETIVEKKISTFPKQSVLVVCIGNSIGKVGISEKISYSNQQITALIAKSNLDRWYVVYLMQSLKKYLRETALYSTIPIINNLDLAEFKIPLPVDKNMQSEISDFLNKKNDIIEKVISNIQCQIKNIDKQKKTLIYDYVTGKRRVEL